MLQVHTFVSAQAEPTSASLGLRLLALQLVRDLLVSLKKLGRTPIKTHGFALAKLAFAVGFVDAFQGADFDHAVASISQSVDCIVKKVPNG